MWRVSETAETSDVASNLYLALEIQFWQFTMSETEEVQRERERRRGGEIARPSCNRVSTLKLYNGTSLGSGHRTLDLYGGEKRSSMKCRMFSLSHVNDIEIDNPRR